MKTKNLTLWQAREQNHQKRKRPPLKHHEVLSISAANALCWKSLQFTIYCKENYTKPFFSPHFFLLILLPFQDLHPKICIYTQKAACRWLRRPSERVAMWYQDREARDLHTGRTKCSSVFKGHIYKGRQNGPVTQDDGNSTGSLSSKSPVSAVLNSNFFVSATTLSTISLSLLPHFRDPQLVSL